MASQDHTARSASRKPQDSNNEAAALAVGAVVAEAYAVGDHRKVKAVLTWFGGHIAGQHQGA